MADTCTHLDTVADVDPSDDGCHECLQTGGRWVDLRMCQSCGHIGCCDNSPGRHAPAHYHASVHPLIRSYEPGADCCWCYPAALFFDVDGEEQVVGVAPPPV